VESAVTQQHEDVIRCSSEGLVSTSERLSRVFRFHGEPLSDRDSEREPTIGASALLRDYCIGRHREQLARRSKHAKSNIYVAKWMLCHGINDSPTDLHDTPALLAREATGRERRKAGYGEQKTDEYAHGDDT